LEPSNSRPNGLVQSGSAIVAAWIPAFAGMTALQMTPVLLCAATLHLSVQTAESEAANLRYVGSLMRNLPGSFRTTRGSRKAGPHSKGGGQFLLRETRVRKSNRGDRDDTDLAPLGRENLAQGASPGLGSRHRSEPRKGRKKLRPRRLLRPYRGYGFIAAGRGPRACALG
jgi:hypothetical protein